MPLIERVLDRVECRTLRDHERRGGGRGLATALISTPDEIADALLAAGLRGRGGAGFPTGVKWRTVAGMPTDVAPTVVVNAAEGEPSTFKDRQLIRMNPYKVLEGALIAACAVQAPEIVVATKGTFRREVAALRRALAEMEDEGWLGGRAVRVVEGPSEYLYGEETALLEVISGRRPFPRVAPPYRRGVEEGGDDLGNTASWVHLVGPEPGSDGPALAENVETLANVTGILADGADWYREVGTADSPGTIVCTMIGHCRTHAVGEVEMGTPLREAIELIGGGAEHTRVVGAMSGVANAIVPEHLLDTPMTYDDMRAIGTGLGAGGYFVLDDRTDVVAVAAGVARFLSIESCGQCEPCKRDGLAIAERLAALTGATPTTQDLDAIPTRIDTVADGARCFLATQQQVVIASALELYPEAFRRRAEGDRTGAADELILPLVDIVEGRAVLDTTHLTKQPDWTHEELDSGTSPVNLEPRPGRTAPAPVPESHERAADAIATGDDAMPAALQPLVELTDGLRRSLDRALTDDDRDAALAALRTQLALYVDVSSRIVHPWASRVDPGEADDAVWQAELDELHAEHLARIDAERPVDPDALEDLVNRTRDIVDDEEARILGMLRAHMDDVQLDELGEGVREACATATTA